MKATLLPVSSALAGHISTRSRRHVTVVSITAATPTDTRIWAIDTLKPRTACPRICRVTMTADSRSRGSRRLGSTTGMRREPIRMLGTLAAPAEAIDEPVTASMGRRRTRC